MNRWTFCGVQLFPGFAAALLVNLPNKSTRALVTYDEDRPVQIRRLP